MAENINNLNLFSLLLNEKESGNHIDFNENFFVDSTSHEEIKQAQRNVFIDFITDWIANFTRRDINKFSLKISNPHSCGNTIESCVEFAAQRRVKDITLDFSDNNNFNNNNNNNALFPVPTQVYQIGSSLESLKLSSCSFNVLDFLSFDALRDLSLSRIRVNIKTLKTLLKICKTMDSLRLEKCWGMEDFDLGREPIWLTRLVIDKCEMDTEYDLTFNAPILKYFKYSGHVCYSYIKARQIEEVDIDFAQESRYNSEHGEAFCDVLGDLYRAKILTVCSYLLQVIPSVDQLDRVLRVKHLILNTQMHPKEIGGLKFLLDRCPLMEKLTMNIGSGGVIFEDYKPSYDLDIKKFWFCGGLFPRCLKRRLKVVEVNNSKATESEFLTLGYFMHTGKVLEEININICNEDDGLTETRYERARTLKNNANRRFSHLQVSIY
ncbi:putative F-box/LRR-repeat protein At1g56400 [Vicia villosa]|uniref:putative F-box/LRR-repeat protein At1g56400 n=1 Tax=Vicia villosa TaxID=3911 RepID=UPI00273B2081|nr:putative F-box/LRR-repeat protein At1g56400 [Vicia villosa]